MALQKTASGSQQFVQVVIALGDDELTCRAAGAFASVPPHLSGSNQTTAVRGRSRSVRQRDLCQRAVAIKWEWSP